MDEPKLPVFQTVARANRDAARAISAMPVRTVIALVSISAVRMVLENLGEVIPHKMTDGYFYEVFVSWIADVVCGALVTAPGVLLFIGVHRLILFGKEEILSIRRYPLSQIAYYTIAIIASCALLKSQSLLPEHIGNIRIDVSSFGFPILIIFVEKSLIFPSIAAGRPNPPQLLSIRPEWGNLFRMIAVYIIVLAPIFLISGFIRSNLDVIGSHDSLIFNTIFGSAAFLGELILLVSASSHIYLALGRNDDVIIAAAAGGSTPTSAP